MPTAYARLKGTRRWVLTWSVLAIVLGLGVVGIALMFTAQDPGSAVMPIALGLAMTIAGGLCLGFAQLLFKLEANSHRIHELLMDGANHQQESTKLLGIIRDNSQISDGVKSVSHRALERDALRKAIREDIVKEDWEAAYSLIDEMETRFGYKIEAYNYRKEVDEFRARVIEDKVQTSLNQTRRLIKTRDWDKAQAEAQRLVKLASDDQRVSEVIDELSSRRAEYKNELLRQWHEAVESKDVEHGIALLKQIDPFLTRDESEKLEDSARKIFKAQLMDLGVRFRSAVTGHRWNDAIHVGERIRSEFPNSLMAKEVGESMSALRSKAIQAK